MYFQDVFRGAVLGSELGVVLPGEAAWEVAWCCQLRLGFAVWQRQRVEVRAWASR